MDTTERKGDVIITRGDTVTNSGGWKRKEEKKKKEKEKIETGDAAATHKHTTGSS